MWLIVKSGWSYQWSTTDSITRWRILVSQTIFGISLSCLCQYRCLSQYQISILLISLSSRLLFLSLPFSLIPFTVTSTRFTISDIKSAAVAFWVLWSVDNVQRWVATWTLPFKLDWRGIFAIGMPFDIELHLDLEHGRKKWIEIGRVLLAWKRCAHPK